MTTSTANFGTLQVGLTLTNLLSLADDAYWQSDGLPNTELGFWMEYFIKILTTTSVGDAAGIVDLYLAESIDGGTSYSGAATGTEGTYAPGANNLDERHLRHVRAFPCDAVEATARTYHYKGTIHDLPEDFAFVIANRTGQAFGATVCEIEYRINKFDAA